VQGAKMICVEFKNMLIECASLIQPTGLAVLCCRCHDLGNVGHVSVLLYKKTCELSI
jgi:hypothetical protein